MIKIEDIYEAYFDCRKHKRKTTNALSFEMNYEEELYKLYSEINSRTYEIGESICFVVTKPKLREVFAADFRDRMVHHLVVRKIEPLLEKVFIEDTYNCRCGKGVLYGINRLHEKIRILSCGYTKDVYIGKFDCKGFFMSIHKPTLWAILEDFIKCNYHEIDKEDILWLTRKIVLHCPHKNCRRKSPPESWDGLEKDKSLFTSGDDYGLPIGNLSSQIFANFYMHEFDIAMSNMFGGYYGRYVDDYYVLSENKEVILRSINTAKMILNTLNVTLHPKKMYIQHYSKGIKFTGGVIKFRRRYISNSTVYNLKNCIKELNNIKDKKMCVERAIQRLNSYFGFCRQYMTYGIRFQMANMLTSEWYKYLYVSKYHNKFVQYKKAKEYDKKNRKNRRLQTNKEDK